MGKLNNRIVFIIWMKFFAFFASLKCWFHKHLDALLFNYLVDFYGLPGILLLWRLPVHLENVPNVDLTSPNFFLCLYFVFVSWTTSRPFNVLFCHHVKKARGPHLATKSLVGHITQFITNPKRGGCINIGLIFKNATLSSNSLNWSFSFRLSSWVFYLNIH